MGDPHYRCCDPEDPISVASMQHNHHFLLTWLALLPTETEEIDDDCYIRTVAARAGYDVAETRANLHMAEQLMRMPRLRDHALQMKHLNRKWLVAITRTCIAVSDEHLPALDTAIVSLVTPTTNNQALPHWRKLSDSIKKLILELDPAAASDELPPREEQLSISHVTGGPSVLHVTYRPDQAYELDALVKAAARTYGCNRAEALLRLARGNAEIRVTLNLYAPDDTHSPVNLGGGLTLDTTASEEWLNRVTTTRDISAVADKSTPHYSIPETYKAFVKGRDGGCRFPGCGAGPEACDIDHVTSFATGGPTTPANLQCLCRTCHNLKTEKLVTASIDDTGTVTWTLPDGNTVTTVPRGPVPTPPNPTTRAA